MNLIGTKKAAGRMLCGIALGIVLLVYLGMAFYFRSHFLPSAALNGRDISGMTQEEVEASIKKGIDGYQLKLIERGGQEEIIKGKEISLNPEFGDSIKSLIEGQNEWVWPAAYFSPREFEEVTVVSFDKDQLKEALGRLNCMQPENQKAPKDAYCSDYAKEGYQVVPEEQGSLLNADKLADITGEAVSNLKKQVSLEEEDCYAKPHITKEDKKLASTVEQLNRYTGASITYQVGEKREVLDGSITHDWMVTEDGRVSINEEAVEEYVGQLASSYNTAFRVHPFKTSYGTAIEINEGDYGWKVDKEGEKEQILKDIKAGKSIEREITYAQRASSHGERDYGTTYVEINLTAQHLFFYKNGALAAESDFVSGNLSKNYDTPTGIYGITYKERDATLKGENYSSDVDYWMPFCNNVGMHDASWRSSFGSNIYKTSGSHGCINLPLAAAKKIFENIEQGDPVLVYRLPGTENPAAVAQEAAQVTNMINSIGAVALESEPAIAAARNMYNLLSDAGRAQVPNYDLLTACEAQLAALKGGV